MKKFEELDRFKQEVSVLQSQPSQPSEDSCSEIRDTQTSEPCEQSQLTEEQLQELFKRTSCFTVKSVMRDDMEEFYDEDLGMVYDPDEDE